MYKRWEENRKELEVLYHKLPFSVFQIRMRSGPVLMRWSTPRQEKLISGVLWYDITIMEILNL